MDLTSFQYFRVQLQQKNEKIHPNAYGTKIDLAVDRSSQPMVMIKNKLCSATDPDATYQVSRQLAQWFWRRRLFFILLSIFEHGGHLGHVTFTFYINFGSPFQRMLHINFWVDWPSGFREEDC